MSSPAYNAVAATEKTAVRLLERYRSVRAQSEALAAPLSAEDQMVQSCAEARPGQVAHGAYQLFFETFVLREFVPAYRDFHPDFHWLSIALPHIGRRTAGEEAASLVLAPGARTDHGLSQSCGRAQSLIC